MKKTFKGIHYPHTLLSKYTCTICGKFIKARLVLIKEMIPRLCYNHWTVRKQAHVKDSNDHNLKMKIW